MKHTNSTTIYNGNLNRKHLQKLFKCQLGGLGAET